jgi:hypothetical protein
MISDPSGFHRGHPAETVESVSGIALPPESCLTKTCSLVAGPAAYAIIRPSGEIAG